MGTSLNSIVFTLCLYHENKRILWQWLKCYSTNFGSSVSTKGKCGVLYMGMVFKDYKRYGLLEYERNIK